MELLLDTANLAAIKKYNDYYNIIGVTTNPSILSKEKQPFYETYEKIRDIIGEEKQLHIQVTGRTCEEMLKEAETITKIEFKSAEEAETVLEDFLTDVEEVELFEDVEPSTEVMQGLRNIREIVVEYIQDIVLELPRTQTIKLNGQTPSLALAYDLYEDISRADEIVKKNHIAFPGFIPANKELKVLTE